MKKFVALAISGAVIGAGLYFGWKSYKNLIDSLKSLNFEGEFPSIEGDE